MGGFSMQVWFLFIVQWNNQDAIEGLIYGELTIVQLDVGISQLLFVEIFSFVDIIKTDEFVLSLNEI